MENIRKELKWWRALDLGEQTRLCKLHTNLSYHALSTNNGKIVYIYNKEHGL